MSGASEVGLLDEAVTHVPQSTVFLVHGRNEEAKEEVQKLLQAYGLRVLPWSESRSTTGRPSPTTLDIVKSGIECTTCTVVLITGDDNARLHPELGDEPYRLQPRPNVVFEMGYAFGNPRTEDRTVIVTIGHAVLLSDIDGINYVTLDNSPHSREDLAHRLRDAGCQITGALSTWTNTKIAGDFDKIAVHEPSEVVYTMPDALPRSLSEFTQFIVDSTVNISVDNFQLQRDIRAAVANSQSLDLKHHYIGTDMAENWVAVCKDISYGHKTLVAHLADAITEIIRLTNLQEEIIDVVSLGPGDGRADVLILQELQSNIRIGSYYPIDISHDLLKLTVNAIIDAFENGSLKTFPIKALEADFEERLVMLDPVINPYQMDPHPNVFFLTGYTLGNTREAGLIDSIKAAMKDDDILVVDARIHSFGLVASATELTDDQKRTLTNPYSSSTIKQFAFGPIELGSHYAVKWGDVDFGYDTETAAVSVVPGSINVFLKCLGLDELPRFQDAVGAERVKTRIARRRRNRSETRLATVTYYDFESLRNWFVERGFEVFWSKEFGSDGFAAFAMRLSD